MKRKNELLHLVNYSVWQKPNKHNNMRYFKILIDRKKSGHWTAFEIQTSEPKLHLHYNRNTQYKQWFCYATLFPFYFSKNNCSMELGLYLIWVKIGIKIQGSFYNGVRRKKELMNLTFTL